MEKIEEGTYRFTNMDTLIPVMYSVTATKANNPV
jgi:hypothetical protein